MGNNSQNTKAVQVLEVIASYGVHSERGSGIWEAFKAYLPTVTKQIASNAAIQMILPGFPFKDPSRAITIGDLPDLGEELALSHLQGLCNNIASVYENGAKVVICSDGLVYNDLMGVSEKNVWEYGEALRSMAAKKELDDIKFVRLWDVLGLEPDCRLDQENQEKAKAYYLEQAHLIRQELVNRHGNVTFDADRAAKFDENLAKTYSAYVDVLAKRTVDNPESSAKEMMPRGKAYAEALRAKFPEYIRLSIHDSTGTDKLSLALIPSERGSVGLMPWRSTIAIDADGSYRNVYPDEIRDTYELVYKNGQPYFYRVKSELFDWSKSGLQVEFEHLYPCGIIVRPVNVDQSPSMRLIPMQKVRHLSNNFAPIVLRGFAETTDEETWVEKGHELGEILSWALTGTIFKVVNSRDDREEANNVTSNESLPMHFDGVFKFAEHTDPATGIVTKVLNPPGYQYFTCIATAPKGDGYTLFCNSRLTFRHMPKPWTLETLEPVTWKMINDGFWSNEHKNMPLVLRHPSTGVPCLRWHSPWGGDKTKYSKYTVVMENADQELVQVIEKLTYDFRTCLRFSWERGDILVNDNMSMLHTRTAYTSDCDREMWRIHLD
ncbi:Pyoverdine/dityrosine biosynthesis protein-domain-containing protein [Xylariaceae sp. FL1272]|nr:Pyoverdine/dityrosine biosynthesis protein-domain-containing protein [Xylariaceae sp. FL1272]